jgi:hypothetical protein
VSFQQAKLARQQNNLVGEADEPARVLEMRASEASDFDTGSHKKIYKPSLRLRCA